MRGTVCEYKRQQQLLRQLHEFVYGRKHLLRGILHVSQHRQRVRTDLQRLRLRATMHGGELCLSRRIRIPLQCLPLLGL